MGNWLWFIVCSARGGGYGNVRPSIIEVKHEAKLSLSSGSEDLALYFNYFHLIVSLFVLSLISPTYFRKVLY